MSECITHHICDCLSKELALARNVVEAARDFMPIFEPEMSEDGTGAPAVVYWRRLDKALAAYDAAKKGGV
jgi:hypothetical protein